MTNNSSKYSNFLDWSYTTLTNQYIIHTNDGKFRIWTESSF